MTQGRNFQRRREDFLCEGCGTQVRGNGYTDHCPNCLLSIHVDVNPGDRASKCRGEMVPIGVQLVKGEFKIAYRCKRCNHIRQIVAAAEDNKDMLIALSSNPID